MSTTRRTSLNFEIQAFGATVATPKGSEQVAKKMMDDYKSCKLFRYNSDGSKTCISEKIAKIRDQESRHEHKETLSKIKGVAGRDSSSISNKRNKASGNLEGLDKNGTRRKGNYLRKGKRSNSSGD